MSSCKSVVVSSASPVYPLARLINQNRCGQRLKAERDGYLPVLRSANAHGVGGAIRV